MCTCALLKQCAARGARPPIEKMPLAWQGGYCSPRRACGLNHEVSKRPQLYSDEYGASPVRVALVAEEFPSLLSRRGYIALVKLFESPWPSVVSQRFHVWKSISQSELTHELLEVFRLAYVPWCGAVGLWPKQLHAGVQQYVVIVV